MTHAVLVFHHLAISHLHLSKVISYYYEGGSNANPDANTFYLTIWCYGMEKTVQLIVDVVHNWECRGSISENIEV